MKLTDARIKRIKPNAKPYKVSDGGGGCQARGFRVPAAGQARSRSNGGFLSQTRRVCRVLFPRLGRSR